MKKFDPKWVLYIQEFTLRTPGTTVTIVQGPDGWQAQRADSAGLEPNGTWRSFDTYKEDEDIHAFRTVEDLWAALWKALNGELRLATEV